MTMLGPFKVLEVVGTSYCLQLPTAMRIHDVFYPSLLRKSCGRSFAGTDERAAATYNGG
jgi:hypothetical protein